MAQKISKLKKAGYAAVAMAMALPVATFLPAGSAFADAGCPASMADLTEALSGTEATISLCGDITLTDAPITVSRSVTLNLGGYSITRESGDIFAISGRNTRLTITGDGNVNGSLGNSNNIRLQGGTYTSSRAQQLADFRNGYMAYSVDGAYVVDQMIWGISVSSPAEFNEDGIFLYEGQTATITAVLNPETSKSGIVFESDDPEVATVSEDGTITAVAAGTTSIVASAEYSPRFIRATMPITVYAVNPATEGDVADTSAADSLKDLISGALDPEADEDLYDSLYKSFGGDDDYAEDTIDYLQWAVVYEGGIVKTAVYVDPADDYLTDEEKEAIIAQMDGDVDPENVKYYDVNVDIEDEEGERIGGIHETNKPIRVIIAQVEKPDDGYARKYYVVAYHNDEDPIPLTEGVDWEIDKDGNIVLISNRFSIFAVGYEDVLVPVVTTPNTGVATVEGDSATQSSMSLAVAAALAAVVAMVGIAKFAKRK
ncbi:Ig-like domain-containing protein [Candidatus Saccharibacteria bacterium]|nr:Ig-like domain-containing protein [Candidatus Saccharibacteria bacterium]